MDGTTEEGTTQTTTTANRPPIRATNKTYTVKLDVRIEIDVDGSTNKVALERATKKVLENLDKIPRCSHDGTVKDLLCEGDPVLLTRKEGRYSLMPIDEKIYTRTITEKKD